MKPKKKNTRKNNTKTKEGAEHLPRRMGKEDRGEAGVGLDRRVKQIKQNKQYDKSKWLVFMIRFANYISHKAFQPTGLSIHSENGPPLSTEGKLSWSSTLC